jgi:hypothetical protein
MRPQLCLTSRLGKIPPTYILCDIVTLTEHIGTKQSNRDKTFSLQERLTGKRLTGNSQVPEMHQEFEHQVL